MNNRYFLIPENEKHLETRQAELFMQVSPYANRHLEGLCFDRNGDLYYTNPFDGGSVWRIDMKSRERTKVFGDEGLYPVAVKIHKNGRLYVCSVGGTKKGCVISMNPDGDDIRTVVAGYDVDDLVFDSEGGFYFTHYVGHVADRSGGIYYVNPQHDQVLPVLLNLASPNGIALSKDEKTLWITEAGMNRLIRHPIKKGGGYHSVCYTFTGYVGPDSCCIDNDDNLYVAMFGQGRVMVFNPWGSPVGQVTVPEFEKGYNLFTSHPALAPGTDDLYIIACDDVGEYGGCIFKAKGYGEWNHHSYQYQ